MYWIGFGPSTFIIMADKTVKRVDLLQSGDQVSCGDNRFAIVHKIVSVDSEQEFQMCNYFGVLLTARSIIKNKNNEWEYWCKLMDSSHHTTSRTIIQIENGTGNPSIDTLNKLTKVLGVEIEFKIISK